jgi:hypothetical protein
MTPGLSFLICEMGNLAGILYLGGISQSQEMYVKWKTQLVTI